MAPPLNPLTTLTDDSVLRSRRHSFRALRALRHSPPGAAQGVRGKVFVAALEQAQQQISAAASIGYESMPLNLFYGLSQAGRAIAAAASCQPDSYSQAAADALSARVKRVKP